MELPPQQSVGSASAAKSVAVVTDDQKGDGPWVFSILDDNKTIYGMVMSVTEAVVDIVVDS